jgi:hypothetical protein
VAAVSKCVCGIGDSFPHACGFLPPREGVGGVFGCEDKPVTYGDISARLQAQVAAQILERAALEARWAVLINPTRWQRFRRLFRFRLLRWWVGERLHDLAYWIEP